MSDSEIRTVIGHGSLLEGSLEMDHGIQVNGTFRGRVTTTTLLHVSDGGELESDVIEVARADIHGTVTGTICAREWVRFGATARMRGRVETPRLIVEEGAMIEAASTAV
jgi:cytoskeletal protein CcmA (bactofilin family)